MQTKAKTFKSLNYLAPEYLSSLFNKNGACNSRNLRNTNTNVRLPRKDTTQGQKLFPFGVPYS